MTASTPGVVARLRELEAAATRGPWAATPATMAGRQMYKVTPQCTDRGSMSGEDAALIAEARNALPALLAVAEAAAALERLIREAGGGREPGPHKTAVDAVTDALAALNDPTREDT